MQWKGIPRHCWDGDDGGEGYVYVSLESFILPLGTVITFLLTDQKFPGLILGSGVENYSTDWVFLYFSVLCPCSVLCCLRWRPCTVLTSSHWRPSDCICVCSLYVLHWNLKTFGVVTWLNVNKNFNRISKITEKRTYNFLISFRRTDH